MIPLIPGMYYHVYNRGINRERIFFEERNYSYFLALFARHVTSIADLFAYCLLPNHFHFLLQIKTGDHLNSSLAAKAFNKLFSSYAKAINKAYARTGSLFQHHFGRIPVTSQRYYSALTCYIHRNPQKHGLVSDFRDWPYSSYPILLSQNPTPVRRVETLEWFGGAAEFQDYHKGWRLGGKIRDLAGNDMD